MKTSKEKVEQWSRDVGWSDNCLFVRKLKQGGLNYDQILIVVDAVNTTCKHCWDDDERCQCWKDE